MLKAAVAIGSIALAGAEAFRVPLHLAHASLELPPALSALDGAPPRRHSHGGMVVSDVIGASSEFKVLKAVVVLDAVEVVNVLVGSESAAKMAFHDDAMLEHVEASSGELYVAVPTDASGDEAVAALARAEAHVPAGSA